MRAASSSASAPFLQPPRRVRSWGPPSLAVLRRRSPPEGALETIPDEPRVQRSSSAGKVESAKIDLDSVSQAVASADTLVAVLDKELIRLQQQCMAPMLHSHLVWSHYQMLGLCAFPAAGFIVAEEWGLWSATLICVVFAGFSLFAWVPSSPKDTHAVPLLKDLSAALSKAQRALASGISQQNEAAKEEEKASRRRFAPDKIFPQEGLRLNFAQGVANLDFKQHVYNLLDDSAKRAYDAFSMKFDRTAGSRMATEETHFYQMPDEFTKLRFLQADHYRIDDAVERLWKTLVWRQTSGLDDFITNPDRALLRRYRSLRIRRLLGYDKENRPFLCERLGEFFGSDWVKDALTMEQWLICYSYDLCEVTAAIRECLEDTGPVPYRHRLGYIGDMRGLRLYQTLKLIPFLKILTKQVDSHFPEFAGPLYLIFAPGIAQKIWALVKPFLDPATASKITIDTTDGRLVIGELFGWDIIPTEFGGYHDFEMPHVPKSIEAFESQHS